MVLPLDHIGIAVSNLDDAISLYTNTFGFEVETRETIASQGVELVFLKLANTRLELLAPTNAVSKLKKFLDTKGPGLHHICYKVDNLKAELARLKALGVKLIDEVPRPGAHNSIIAFLHPSSFGGVLTELCEYPKQPRN